MSKKYSVYFWEPELSPHKLPLFYELAAQERVEKAYYIAESTLPDHRKRLGWDGNFDENRRDIIIAPSQLEVTRIVVESAPDAIHIFSGLRWVPCIVHGLDAAIKHGRRFGVLQEPRVLEGIKGIVRLAHSWATEQRIRTRASFILAIGAHGPRWFKIAGYDPRKIFPFAYFLPYKRGAAVGPGSDHGGPTVVAFLGRLERAKGLHKFLACLPLIGNGVHVRVAGVGSLGPDVINAKKTFPFLSFSGSIPSSAVPQFLADTDILILPSLTMDDGWGAVVSEALMAGAAVICSNKVGASMCLMERERGVVVERITAANLASSVDSLINDGYTRREYRAKRTNWASSHLDQVNGAKYLIRIFDYCFERGESPEPFI